MNAVVLVSGGAAVTPFTTPDQAAGAGLAAGNTLTALRAHLLAAGHTVFTAPARIGEGTVDEDAGWQGFSEVPVVLPADLTVNAVGEIDPAGAALHRFLLHLRDAYGVSSVQVVAHSMGGLFTRAAIRAGADAGEPPMVRRLITLGTPWTGSLVGDFLSGSITLADAHDDPATAGILQQGETYAAQVSQGGGAQVGKAFLAGDAGWNARQGDALVGIPVTLIAGDHFGAHDDPADLWPHDGLVSRRSARGEDVPEQVLPQREVHTFPDVHSIFFADAFALPWERALTWNPDVLELVDGILTR